MSLLLDLPPFGDRRDDILLTEMRRTTEFHLEHCAPYRRVWSHWRQATTFADLPYLHAGVFKDRLLIADGVDHGRTLTSSGTAGAQSKIVLEPQSSKLQARSSAAILADFIGAERTPLIILDSAHALRARGTVQARIAAALSLQPLATDVEFVMRDDAVDSVVDWSRVTATAARADHFRVYGITSVLWFAWAENVPPEVARALSNVRIDFIHSGGWKKLESLRVERKTFEERLLRSGRSDSRVVDYYGLVEQIGIVYPLCKEGFRHVPIWAAVIVRDPFTLAPVMDGSNGLLQLMNPFSLGSPSHNVLTEDLGRLIPGSCRCGRGGERFELQGRVPKVDVRGCANV